MPSHAGPMRRAADIIGNQIAAALPGKNAEVSSSKLDDTTIEKQSYFELRSGNQLLVRPSLEGLCYAFGTLTDLMEPCAITCFRGCFCPPCTLQSGKHVVEL
jgi:hypothetical protein